MELDVEAARALHDDTPVVDLHADTAKLMQVFGYDLFLRHEPPLPRAAWFGHVDVPRMREGGLCAQFFGLWTFPVPQRGCAASVAAQLDVLERDVAAHPDDLEWCWSGADVRRAKAAGRIAVLAGLEGAHALEGRPERVNELARRGVRYIGLVHLSANAVAAPSLGLGRRRDRGLGELAHDAIAEADRMGMLVDLAHISRRGFFEALAATRGVPIVSHTGVTGVARSWRNIDDEQIRAIAGRGGIVGIIFAPRFLGCDGIGAVRAHLEHVVNVAGEDTAALGSDFDGMVRPPKGLEDVACLPRLTATLLAGGMPERVVRKLLGENALRVLGDAPGGRSASQPDAAAQLR